MTFLYKFSLQTTNQLYLTLIANLFTMNNQRDRSLLNAVNYPHPPNKNIKKIKKIN